MSESKKQKNIIPKITEPLGKYWEQPSTNNILIDDTHALMDEKSFKELKDYSKSQPTGAYEGKMWKATYWDRPGIWFLLWFDFHEDPKFLSTEQREIILL